MVYEIMKGLKSLMHVKAFDTMIRRWRKVAYARLSVSISIHYSIAVNRMTTKFWVFGRRTLDNVDCLP